MPREYIVAWAGRHQRDRWEDLCADYRGRIARFTPVRELAVKLRRPPESPKARLEAEAKELLAALPDPVWIIALDRRGKQFSSRELATDLARLRDEWPHPVAFVIGSDLGLDAELLAQARVRISFGKLTLPHELARLVLYEQLYRSVAIDAGINYHRDPF